MLPDRRGMSYAERLRMNQAYIDAVLQMSSAEGFRMSAETAEDLRVLRDEMGTPVHPVSRVLDESFTGDRACLNVVCWDGSQP